MTKGSMLLPRTLLLAHAALGARWLVFPGILFWVSQSVGVTLQLGGWLCGWSVMVLLADSAAAVCLSASRAARTGVVVVTSVINVTLSTLLAWGAPVVGHELVFLPSALALACAVCCCRRRRPAAFYTTWAVVETCVGVGFGHVLLWALQQLLADERGSLEEAWEPVLVVLQVNVVLSWLSLLLQLLIFKSLGARSRSDGASTPMSSLEDPSFAEPDSVELFPDTSMCIFTCSLRLRKRSRRLGRSLAAGLWVSYAALLFAGAVGYLWFLHDRMGAIYLAGSPAPECSSCYCRRHFADFEVKKNVTYGEALDPLTGKAVELRMDVYHGKGAALQRRPRAPAVLFMHGGGFHGGDKMKSVLTDEARELARHGFVTFSLNYRLLGRVGLPQTGAVRDAVEDLRAAVRYVVAHAQELGVDADRVAVWGSSAGAITAASVSFADDRASSGSSGYPSNVTAAVGISGSIWPFAVRDARLRGGGLPRPAPWFDIHGTADSIVPFFMTKMTHLYLQFLGLPPESNRLAVVPGAGHVPWRIGGKDRNCSADAQPCSTLRPHVYAFLSHAMRLESLPCPTTKAPHAD